MVDLSKDLNKDFGWRPDEGQGEPKWRAAKYPLFAPMSKIRTFESGSDFRRATCTCSRNLATVANSKILCVQPPRGISNLPKCAAWFAESRESQLWLVDHWGQVRSYSLVATPSSYVEEREALFSKNAAEGLVVQADYKETSQRTPMKQ